jgi:hypothetical protein
LFSIKISLYLSIIKYFFINIDLFVIDYHLLLNYLLTKNYFMKKTKHFLISIIYLVFILPMIGFSQNKELKNSEIPQDVVNILNEYMKILTTSTSVDDAAGKLVKIAGGHLLTSDLSGISNDVKPYSLKKDFENAKFYAYPPVITRCVLMPNDYDGYQTTLIEGDRYKIWIKKKDGVNGMPAPIPIIKPKTGDPKVVSNIGSL